MDTFQSSGHRALGVQPTPSRILQYVIGITPGKVVEQYNAEKQNKSWTDAIYAYGRDVGTRYDNASSAAEKKRILVEVNEDFHKIAPTLYSHGINAIDQRNKIINSAIRRDMRNSMGTLPQGIK